MHLFTQFGDELQPLGDEQVLGQRLGQIAFVPHALAEQPFGEFGNRLPIIDIARRQAKGQEFTLVITLPYILVLLFDMCKASETNLKWNHWCEAIC